MRRLKSLKGNVVEGLQSIEWVVFLLEFYVCHRVFPKYVFLLLTQECYERRVGLQLLSAMV